MRLMRLMRLVVGVDGGVTVRCQRVVTVRCQRVVIVRYQRVVTVRCQRDCKVRVGRMSMSFRDHLSLL